MSTLVEKPVCPSTVGPLGGRPPSAQPTFVMARAVPTCAGVASGSNIVRWKVQPSPSRLLELGREERTAGGRRGRTTNAPRGTAVRPLRLPAYSGFGHRSPPFPAPEGCTGFQRKPRQLKTTVLTCFRTFYVIRRRRVTVLS